MAKKDSVEMLKNKIELLQRARKNIRKGPANRYPGLCSALCNSYNCWSEQHLYKAADNLLEYIGRVLGRHSYLSGWILNKRPNLKTDQASMKKFRLQWLDWMLNSLQEDLKAKRNYR